MTEFTKKNKALIFAAVTVSAAALVLIAASFAQILSVVLGGTSSSLSGDIRIGELLSGFLLPLGAAIVIGFALAILWPLCKGAAPFTGRNVLLLRCAGLTVLVLEPVHYLIQMFHNHFRPLTADGVKITYFTGFGGIFIALGLIVLSMSFVFAYGVMLQQESDETL